MPFKATVNWLFNDIWCHLVIGCFVWKTGFFQQTVVRVYYILKSKNDDKTDYMKKSRDIKIYSQLKAHIEFTKIR